MKKANLFKKAQISVEMLIVMGIFIIGAILVGVLIINNLNSTQDSTENASNIDPLIDNFTIDAAAALGNGSDIFTANISSPLNNSSIIQFTVVNFTANYDGNIGTVVCSWVDNLGTGYGGCNFTLNLIDLAVDNMVLTIKDLGTNPPIEKTMDVNITLIPVGAT